ncbi:hypothetical protein M9Y10_036425 [Tritrichomonas musculus]|uniref:DUF3447 domain-containing protein n=1 Tax=Tritrichomonas musculus TaxID=1915356 RepID=A0ABR2GU26_9EUKA
MSIYFFHLRMTYTLFLERENTQYNQRESFDSYSLLDFLPDLIKYIPRNFEISTNNGKYKFNKDLTNIFIPDIKDAIKENNDIKEFHFDIYDEQNVMVKVERLFKGETVDFFKSEEKSIKKITTFFLNIVFPESMLENTTNFTDKLNQEKVFPEQISLRINYPILFNNIRNLPRIFTIKTNQNEYKCNRISILCSNAIQSFLKSNPNAKKFDFNFNEKNHEFQLMANFFNGCNITFNKQNKDLLLSISEQLDIKPLVESINAFTQKVNENVSKSIECQKIFEPCKKLFESLFNIKQLGLENVMDYIMKSDWLKSKLEAQEFVACFLHVIKNSFRDHSILADLIKKLSEQSNLKQEITFLIHFLINKLFLYFHQLNEFASFLYHLYRNDLVSIDLIIKKIFIKINIGKRNKSMNYNSNRAIDFSIIWFLPELFERNKQIVLCDTLHDKVAQIKEVYGKSDSFDSLAERIRLMRDNQGQNDLIIQSISEDDLNTFQTIVTQYGIDVHTKKIKMTIFDGYQGEISYIDYSAMRGSLKCFKYLFLEDAPINSDTFMYSIQGSNTEIIHILDQNKDKFVKTNKKGQIGYLSQSDKSMAKAIETSIRMHKNDIFDWIFENQNDFNSDYDYLCLLRIAVTNGNTHAISQIIVNVLNLRSQPLLLTEIIEKACLNGFFKILSYFSLLVSFDSLFNENSCRGSNKKPLMKSNCYKFQILQNSVSFGMLSIFELLLKYQRVKYSSDLHRALVESVESNNVDIVKYILDNKIYKLSPLFLIEAVTNSVFFGSEDVTSYFLENEIDFPITNEILEAACSSHNIKLVEFLIQKSKEKNIYLDFNKSFENAICPYSDELIRVFIENKVSFSLNEKMLQSALRTNPRIIILLINNETNLEIKNELINDSLKGVLCSNNVEILKFLISNKIDFNGLLIKAVKSSNLEVVKTILDHNHSLEFINEVGFSGTALFEAVRNSKNDMVHHLLQVKGIDPSISVDSFETPLVEAVNKNNVEAVDLILNFYGDDIKDQGIQIQNALKQSQRRNPNNYKEQLIYKKLSSIKNLTPSDDAEDLLFNAIISKNVDLVKKILSDESIDLTKKMPSGNTYLHLAFKGPEITQIQKLLISHQQLDINSLNILNETPLIKALKNGNEELADLILNHPKFNPRLNNMNYAFFLSIKMKDISRQIIKMESLDVNYNYQQEDNITNPLIESIKINDFELIESIINHPSFSLIKSKINTCLFLTIELKNTNLFKFFVKLDGVDINIKNMQNQSLLYLASLNEDDEILDEILENENFDPNKSDI